MCCDWYVSSPTWSPDGNKIAFVTFGSCSDGVPSCYFIYVIDALGGSPRQLTTTDGADANPRWSPDGKKIAYTHTSGPSDQTQVYVINADGLTAATQLTKVHGGTTNPSWSADGSRLQFTAYKSGLWTMNANGTGQQQIAGTTASDMRADWAGCPPF